jgi:hypothetical protein
MQAAQMAPPAPFSPIQRKRIENPAFWTESWQDRIIKTKQTDFWDFGQVFSS